MWGITVHGVGVNDGCIREISFIELALSLSKSVILEEVLTGDVDLSISLHWSANWVDSINGWHLVVSEDLDTSVESVLSVLDGKSGLSSLVEWWSDATQVGWTQEFGSDSNTSEDANWVSGMVEFGSKYIHYGSTGNWTSQWSNFRKTWWVEEDELKTISHILVVQGKLKENACQWWVEVVWWRLASGFSARFDKSWLLSEGSKNAESIVGVVDVVHEVERHEVVSSQGDRGSSTKWCEIWNELLNVGVVIIPELDIFLRVLLSVKRNREWLSSLDDIRMCGSAPNETSGYKIGFCTPSTEVASEIISKIVEVASPDLDDCVTILGSVTWIDVRNGNLFIVSIWK